MLFVGLAVLALGAVDSPVTRVVELISGLKMKIQQDGKAEQALYDKYACWCEKTLARKAVDISTAKDTIDELQTLITKLKGELGTHNAEIKQLKKDIEANNQAQTDATGLRDKADKVKMLSQKEQVLVLFKNTKMPKADDPRSQLI